MVQRNGSRYEVRSVARGLDVLETLARMPAGTADLATLASATDLHPSTVFRLLETLMSRGFVEGTRSGYQVGPRAFEVGSAFLRGASLWGYASALAEHLAAETNETANVGVLDRGQVLYIAIAHGQSELGIQSFAGTRHPAHCTALGKAILAAMPWREAEAILLATDLVRLTPATITTLAALRVELATIAQRGYAVDDEERNPGVRCIGVPIWDHTGRIAAASVSGPTIRMQGPAFDAVRDAVIVAGREATRRLGGTGVRGWVGS